MVLKLNKPICFFDLETTGVQVATDRIVEISILKVWPNGNKESVTWRVNPEQPIPAQATEIHGIDDDMVADQPNFKTLAPKVIHGGARGRQMPVNVERSRTLFPGGAGRVGDAAWRGGGIRGTVALSLPLPP